MNMPWKLYMGTISLEMNRQARAKGPTYCVSEWAGRFAQAGFDGMELWEYHATRCAPEELAALEAARPPVTVFNSYAELDDSGREGRAVATALAQRLGAQGIKFNVGKDPAERDVYLASLRDWREQLPEDILLLCECHPGTIIEEVGEARRFFDDLGVAGWEIIVHPFNRLESLRPWFDAFGPAVTLAHLQMRWEDRTIIRFDRRPERVREAVRIMRQAGFSGACTFEFTEGANALGENIEELWRNTLLDLAYLKEVMAS